MNISDDEIEKRKPMVDQNATLWEIILEARDKTVNERMEQILNQATRDRYQIGQYCTNETNNG